MVRFRLFDIPISISPSLWLVLALLGGDLYMNSTADLLPVAIFVVAGFASLLVHELGHAVVGRTLGGGHPQIHMAWLGGVCHNPDGRWTRQEGIAMTAAGPLASLALGTLAVAVLGLWLGDAQLGLRLAWAVIWPSGSHLSQGDIVYLASLNGGAFSLVAKIIWISFWWSALNLLPVYPLDGGQIMGGLMNSARKLHMCSLIVAIVCLLLSLFFHFLELALFMLYFAIFNFRAMQAPSI